MSLTRFVKVGNISNLSDARYCAGMGVDMLGFRVIESQSNSMTSKQFQEIRGWVTGPKIVAEVYGINDNNDLTPIIENYRPDLIELGLDELDRIGGPPIPFILSVSSKELDRLKMINTKPDYILIRDFTNDLDLMLSSPVIIELTKMKLEDISPDFADCGIALNGSAEISPGLKSYDELADVLEKLEDNN
jgi:phosphoribosylanthranilate isomerase